MSTVRRLLAGATVGVLTLLGLAPAAQAAEPEVMLTSSNMLEEQGPLQGTINVDPAEGQTLVQTSYDLVPESGSNDPGDPCFVELPEDERIEKFPADTTEATFDFDVTFPCNRVYQLVVTVVFEEEGLPLIDPPPDPVSVPLTFSVAIPPAEVEGLEATYDGGTREVRLTWAPNPEPDLVGYLVERNPPGPTGFVRIGDGVMPETAFTDPDIGDEQRYRVIAVRRGAGPGSEILGAASRAVTAGPEAPGPTVPDAPPPDRGRSGPRPSSPGGNGTGGGSAPSQTRTTSNIFEETLPFDPNQTTTTTPGSSEPPEDAAVLAEFDDAGSDADQQRATLVPVAGGLALLVGALHLFLLSKRAGQSDIPIVRR